MNDLDVYHWHEAMHTTSIIQSMIVDYLDNHWTGGVAQRHYPEISEKLTIAIDALADYYTWCAEQQDKLLEEKKNETI